MKRSISTLALVVFAMLITLARFSVLEVKAAPGTGTLFGTDAGGDNLLTIDPTTGVGTIVGPMGTGGAPSLAVDPKTGKIYVGGGGGVPFVYEVNPGTGEATLIGDSGLGLGAAGIGAMDFSADGTLYASVNIAGNGGTGPDHLAIIDKESGKATIIGSFGECTGVVVPSDGGGECTIEGIAGLAFDASGTLWGSLTARGAAGDSGLYTIDINTGEATFISPIVDSSETPPSGGVGSLQFGCDSTLYGGTPKAMGNADDGGRLITIDLKTGHFAFLGMEPAAGENSLGALAFQEPCPPEPHVFDLTDFNNGVKTFSLGFIEDDPVFFDESPDEQFRDDFVVPLISEVLEDEIIELLSSNADESLGVIEIAGSWGFPDNLRLGVLTQDGFGNTSAFRLTKQIPLPQPETFPILRMDFGWTFLNEDADPLSSFIVFQASRNPLDPGTNVDPLINFREEFLNGELIVFASISGSLETVFKSLTVVIPPWVSVPTGFLVKKWIDAVKDNHDPKLTVLLDPEQPDDQTGWFKEPVKWFAKATDNQFEDTGLSRLTAFWIRKDDDKRFTDLNAPRLVKLGQEPELRLPKEEDKKYTLEDGIWEIFVIAIDNASTVRKDEFDEILKIDTLKPSCKLNSKDNGLTVTVQDGPVDPPFGSGLKSIEVTSATNATNNGSELKAGDTITGFTEGQNMEFSFDIGKKDANKSAAIAFEIKDVAGNIVTCDPVITLVIRERGKPVSETFTNIPQVESNVTVYNGEPGIKNLIITVNGTMFRMIGLRNNENRDIDVSSAMVAGDNNTITLGAWGKPGASATVIISD